MSRERKPRVLVCASGMGIYPSSDRDILTEESPTGSNFLAWLQRDGEAAANLAAAVGIRVVHLRIPMVLGGPTPDSMARQVHVLGSGRQWWSWVALDDIPTIVEHILLTETLVGPVNVGSPNPVEAATFMATLARIQRRRPARGLPTFLLRPVLGETVDALLLASRRMQPAKLLSTGYTFRYGELEAALRHQLAESPRESGSTSGDRTAPATAYSCARQARDQWSCRDVSPASTGAAREAGNRLFTVRY